jgi:hypothetical protein
MAKSKPNLPKLERNYTRYRGELERLEKKYNGLLNPHDIVREASRDKSPLHDWFDWKDDEAGEKWRIHQARLLLNSIKVKVMFENGSREYRKYLNVTIGKNSHAKRYYVSAKTVLNTENLKQQVLRRAIKEAEYWERTYQDYQELEDIFKGITKTKKKLIKKKLLVNYS